MRSKFQKWTDEETAIARKLLDERAPDSAFRAQLSGRSKLCARSRVERVDYMAHFGQRHEEDRVVNTVPMEVWAERSRRLAAPQPAFGDPPVGFSALDRKRVSA